MFYSTMKGFLSGILQRSQSSVLLVLNARKNSFSAVLHAQNRAYWEVHLCTSKESEGEYEVGAVELDI